MINTIQRILCFGDSLTAGYYNNGDDFHPYSILLSNLLGNVEVDHIGLSGITVEEMVEQIDNSNCVDCVDRVWNGLRVQLKQKKYDLCIILAGTNDIDDGDEVSITENIFKLHKIANDEGCNTIALTIPPMKIENIIPRITKVRTEVNNNLKNDPARVFNALEPHNTYDVIDIDTELFTTSSDKMELYSDGIHLTPDGYDMIAKIIFTHISSECQIEMK